MELPGAKCPLEMNRRHPHLRHGIDSNGISVRCPDIAQLAGSSFVPERRRGHLSRLKLQ